MSCHSLLARLMTETSMTFEKAALFAGETIGREIMVESFTLLVLVKVNVSFKEDGYKFSQLYS